MIALQRISPRPLAFAVKTTAACLIGLYVAFCFNLDQPQWTALTIFIVAQPQSTGGIFGKAFFRIIGTSIGCVVALTLVGLFAQERVLFLGSLSIWVGLCTFASQRVRNWANYGCVLAGYTAAIIGVPTTLNPSAAFYYANARFTEICIGVIVGACAAHFLAPAPIAKALRGAVADSRRKAAAYVGGALNGADPSRDRAAVIASAARIDELLNSALFEDQPTRRACDRIRGLAGALIDLIASAEPLERQLSVLSRNADPAGGCALPLIGAEAAEAIAAWQADAIDAGVLAQRLLALRDRARLADAGEDRRDVALADRLATFLESMAAFAAAWEAAASDRPIAPSHFPLDPADDLFSAAMTGLRSALAVAFAGLFWILTAWPDGASATLLSALGTSRASTMGRVVPLAILTFATFALVSIPSFFIVEVLLPQVSGFPMFALLLSPMAFLLAYLMAFRQTIMPAYMSAMYFFTAAGIQNRMSYNPVGFINLTLAALFAVAMALILWGLVAPDSPHKHRLRFVRAAAKALRSLANARDAAARRNRFESAAGGALVRLARELNLSRADDQACEQAAFALLGAGRELASLLADRQPVRRRGAGLDEVVRAARRCLDALSRREPIAAELRNAVRSLGEAVDALARPTPSPKAAVGVGSDVL